MKLALKEKEARKAILGDPKLTAYKLAEVLFRSDRAIMNGHLAFCMTVTDHGASTETFDPVIGE